MKFFLLIPSYFEIIILTKRRSQDIKRLKEWETKGKSKIEETHHTNNSSPKINTSKNKKNKTLHALLSLQDLPSRLWTTFSFSLFQATIHRRTISNTAEFDTPTHSGPGISLQLCMFGTRSPVLRWQLCMFGTRPVLRWLLCMFGTQPERKSVAKFLYC